MWKGKLYGKYFLRQFNKALRTIRVYDPRNTTRSFLKKQQKNEKLALNNEWDYSETATINGLDYSFNYSYIKDAKWLDIIVYCFDKNVVLDFGYSSTPCDGRDDKTILPKKEFIKIIKNLEY